MQPPPTSWSFVEQRLDAWRAGKTSWTSIYLLNPHARLSDVVTVGIWFVIICAVRLSLVGAWHPRFKKAVPVFRRLTRNVAKKGKAFKLSENLWYTLWHTTSFTCGLLTLYIEGNTPEEPGWTRMLWRTGDVKWFWLPTPAELAMGDRGWPLHHLREWTKLFYLIECAFWLSCAAFLLGEKKREDFRAMVIHHLATSWLIVGSYLCSYWRIGTVILVTHDVADILLYMAKSLSYTIAWPTFVDCWFAMFAIGFFLSRLVFFPFFCVRPTISKGFIEWTSGEIDSRWKIPGGVILPAFLCILQLLHIFWFGLILRMIAKTMSGTRVSEDGDIRSDDEGDDEADDYYVAAADAPHRDVRKRTQRPTGPGTARGGELSSEKRNARD